MVNTKPVAELPRFVVPRLTWTTHKLSNGKPSANSTLGRKTRVASVSIQSPKSYHSSNRQSLNVRSPTISPRKQASSTSSPRTTGTSALVASASRSTPTAPIRYNGVYASSYKAARRAFSSSSSSSYSATSPQQFHVTRRSQKSHHFDTLKFVQRLKSEGFNEAQATAMMRVLNDVIEESIQNLTRTMVLKEDAERTTYTQKVDFAKLRSELANADSSELQLTRSSHEKLTSDLAKLNSRLRDEIGRTQASVRLDLNLEKGRIREEANTQEMRIKETEARIEQEVAGLRERVEAVKFSTLQWLMGVCTGTAALILGAWRLLM